MSSTMQYLEANLMKKNEVEAMNKWLRDVNEVCTYT